MKLTCNVSPVWCLGFFPLLLLCSQDTPCVTEYPKNIQCIWPAVHLFSSISL